MNSNTFNLSLSEELVAARTQHKDKRKEEVCAATNSDQPGHLATLCAYNRWRVRVGARFPVPCHQQWQHVQSVHVHASDWLGQVRMYYIKFTVTAADCHIYNNALILNEETLNAHYRLLLCANSSFGGTFDDVRKL